MEPVFKDLRIEKMGVLGSTILWFLDMSLAQCVGI
jgi:hypothetical protein